MRRTVVTLTTLALLLPIPALGFTEMCPGGNTGNPSSEETFEGLSTAAKRIKTHMQSAVCSSACFDLNVSFSLDFNKDDIQKSKLKVSVKAENKCTSGENAAENGRGCDSKDQQPPLITVKTPAIHATFLGGITINVPSRQEGPSSRCNAKGVIGDVDKVVETMTTPGLGYEDKVKAVLDQLNENLPKYTSGVIPDGGIPVLMSTLTTQIRDLPADQAIPAELTAKLEKLVPGSGDIIGTLGANRDAVANALDALANKKPDEAKSILSGAGISDAQIQTLTSGMQKLAARAQADPKQFAQDIAQMFLPPDAQKTVTGFITQAGTFDFKKVVGAITSGNLNGILGTPGQVEPPEKRNGPPNVNNPFGGILGALGIQNPDLRNLFGGSPFGALFGGNTNGLNGIFSSIASLFGGTTNSQNSGSISYTPGAIYSQDTPCMTSQTPIEIYMIPTGTPYPSGCYPIPRQQPQQQPAQQAPRPAAPAAAPAQPAPQIQPQPQPLPPVSQILNTNPLPNISQVQPVATLIVQPKQVTRGNPITLAWSSVGMSVTPCVVLLNSGNGTSTVAIGNEGTKILHTDKSMAAASWSLALSCTSLSGTTVTSAASVLLK